MNSVDTAARRAQRLARWYPSEWRARYGDEFTDLLEQEIAETPHNVRRTLNVVRKGAATRLRELGVVGETMNPADQFRVSASMSIFAGGLFCAMALDLWSNAMVTWGFGSQASLQVTIMLGANTVVTIAIAVLIAAYLCAASVAAVSKALRADGRSLRAPLALIFGSLTVIAVSLVARNPFWPVWSGLRWGSPGILIKQIAQSINTAFFQSTYFPTMGGFNSGNIGADGLWRLIAWTLFPIALGTLAWGLALAVRRTNFTDRAKRLTRVEINALGVAMLAYLATVAAEFAVGVRFTNEVSRPVLWSGGVPTALGFIVALVIVSILDMKSTRGVHRKLIPGLSHGD
jgi:hypothetical protein